MSLLVQICSYNSNMQGEAMAPKAGTGDTNLVDWLAPTLETSSFLANREGGRAPDIIAVGFQELVALRVGLSGRSEQTLSTRNKLIQSELERHHGSPYVAVAKVVNVGVALLVYARDDNDVARRIRDVETEWTGTGPMWMGNKGAVGVRFTIEAKAGGKTAPEVFTFVNAHLTAHAPKYSRRVEDYHHIVQSLLFKPLDVTSNAPSTIYDSSHLFFFGDLNFRLTPLKRGDDFPTHSELLDLNGSLDGRRRLAEYDQLTRAWRNDQVCAGLKEGEFAQFPCSYKYKPGTVSEYSRKRTPAWTDRILYATHSDDPSSSASHIKNVLYTSILAFTRSDHKPITALLLLPLPSPLLSSTSSRPPLISLPLSYKRLAASRKAKFFTRSVGKPLDHLVGWPWSAVWLLGGGNAGVGVGVVVLIIGALLWWFRRSL